MPGFLGSRTRIPAIGSFPLGKLRGGGSSRGSFQSLRSDGPNVEHHNPQANPSGLRDEKPDTSRWLILRWLLTTAILVATIVTLGVYEKMGNFSSAQKGIFNALILVLSIVLSLSFFDAFKDLAKVLRWRILGHGHNESDLQLILELDKLMSVVKLCGRSLRGLRRPIVALLCLLWLSMNLAAQVSVALVSQVYELEDGKDYNGTYLETGNVSVPDLSCYFHHTKSWTACPSVNEQETTQTIANLYGNAPASFGCGNYTTLADILQSRYTYPYYCRRTRRQQEFTYRFLDFNPKDDERVYPAFSNRTITASSGPCLKYQVKGAPTVKGGFFNYTFSNGTYTGSIEIPQRYEALRSTIYIYRGIDIPQRATKYSCGDRCIWMWAHRSALLRPSDPSFFQCPITVSEVLNSKSASHEISNDIARLAASSIALEGKTLSKDIWTQYRFYPFGNPWDVHWREPDEVGANMAEFALRSIASMTQEHRNVTIPGQQVPILGSNLNVNWKFVTALFISIAAVHFLLAGSTLFITKSTVVQDDSHLVMARLLYPIARERSDPPREYDIHRQQGGNQGEPLYEYARHQRVVAQASDASHHQDSYQQQDDGLKTGHQRDDVSGFEE